MFSGGGVEQRGFRMEEGFSSYSSLYDTSSLLQFCNGNKLLSSPRSITLTCSVCLWVRI